MRSENVSILNEVLERVQGSEYCFMLNFGGLKVDQMTALRQALAKQESRVLVVKNTYLGKVAAEQGFEDIKELLIGPTALVTGSGDVAEVAKVLVEFAKKNEKASVKGATLEKAALSADDVQALSKLPSKDAMRGVLLSTMLAPATDMVRVLNAPLLDMLYALKAYEEKQGGSAA